MNRPTGPAPTTNTWVSEVIRYPLLPASCDAQCERDDAGRKKKYGPSVVYWLDSQQQKERARHRHGLYSPAADHRGDDEPERDPGNRADQALRSAGKRRAGVRFQHHRDGQRNPIAKGWIP